jgi:hypothetical protein
MDDESHEPSAAMRARWFRASQKLTQVVIKGRRYPRIRFGQMGKFLGGEIEGEAETVACLCGASAHEGGKPDFHLLARHRDDLTKWVPYCDHEVCPACSGSKQGPVDLIECSHGKSFEE